MTIRLPVRECDKETGLYYNHARYYDPKAGRFTQKDPIGFAGGDVNMYAYVGNNPVNYIDPEGLLRTTRGFGGIGRFGGGGRLGGGSRGGKATISNYNVNAYIEARNDYNADMLFSTDRPLNVNVDTASNYVGHSTVCYSYNNIPPDLVKYAPSWAINTARKLCTTKVPLVRRCCPSVCFGIYNDNGRKGFFVGLTEGCTLW